MVSPSIAPSKGITDEQSLKTASAALGVPFVRLAGRTIAPEVLNRVPETVATEFGIVCYEETRLGSGRKVLRLAVADPDQLEREAPPVIAELHRRDGFLIEIALTLPVDLEAVLDQYPSAPPLGPELGVEGLGTSPSAPPPKANQSKTTGPIETVDLKKRTIPADVLERIPEETARKYRVAVFDAQNGGQTIHVAAEAPDNPQVQDLLSFIRDANHLDTKVFKTSPSSIDHALSGYQSQPPVKLAPPIKLQPEKTASAAPVKPAVKLIKPPAPLEKPVLPSPEPALPDLRLKSPTPLVPLNADVERDLRALVGQSLSSAKDLEPIIATGFIPKIVGAVILLAAKLKASDIHIQAEKDDLRVRYRIDGILTDVARLPAQLLAPIISRIKILAKLKIDEQRIPQDGRFDVLVDQAEIDLRISTLPTIRGEKVVIRLLDKSAGLLKLEQLGFEGGSLEAIRAEIKKPYGVILATGPTGSGKTTTLYAVLQEISAPGVNVVTLEDPVEYEIDGINQVQIRPKIGFGFADGLRSILRQDPNIIMVGEVRDSETANLMTHAALTGHLVLSTLHTNDAAGALPRLQDMGVEPFLITSAVNAVIAQRLVRKLCETCRAPWQPADDVSQKVKERLKIGNHPELAKLAEGTLKLWKAKGCPKCHEGYLGRLGIYELMLMTDELERLAVKRAPASELAEAAIGAGMVTLEQDGLRKALEGLTTLDEVFRVTTTE